jgi:hypothetical protein
LNNNSNGEYIFDRKNNKPKSISLRYPSSGNISSDIEQKECNEYMESEGVNNPTNEVNERSITVSFYNRMGKRIKKSVGIIDNDNPNNYNTESSNFPNEIFAKQQINELDYEDEEKK